jgi:hypothetical protein
MAARTPWQPTLGHAAQDLQPAKFEAIYDQTQESPTTEAGLN